MAGRGAELRMIDAVLTGAAERGVVISGPAGVGKSRLAREASDAFAAQGWTVKHIACTATSRTVPLGAFARWIDTNAQLPVARAQRMVETMTASAGGPLLLCIDDAHLLDEVSAFVLHEIVLHHDGRLLATARAGEPLLDAITAPWKDGLLRWLELPPLDRPDCAALLRSALDAPVAHADLDRLWTLTQGNVLLLRHLVIQESSAGRLTRRGQAWRWDRTGMVTPSVRQLVESQIGGVSSAVRDVVDLVAVSEPMDQRCLAELAPAAAIEDAEHSGLIRADGDAMRVGHPLYAEVRLAQAPSSRLRTLRGRVATVLHGRTGSAAPDAIRLGLLWLDSDLPPDPEVLLLAAELAAARQDAALAVRLANGAIDAGGGTRAKLQYAYALLRLGRGDEAQVVLDLIDPEDVPGNAYLNDVILRAETLTGPLRRPDEAWQLIDTALAAASGSRAHHLRTCRAVQATMAGRPLDVLTVLDAVDLEQLDPFGRIIGLSSRTAAFGELGDPDAACAAAIEGANVIAHAPGAVHLATAIGEFHCAALLMAGRVHEAVAVADDYLRDCQDAPGLPLSMSLAAAGSAALGAGDLPTATQRLNPDRLEFSNHDDITGLTYRFWAMYAEALARSGSTDSAEAAIIRAAALHHPAWGYVTPTYLLARAWVDATRGRIPSALEHGRNAVAVARAQNQRAREVISFQTCLQLGDGAVSPARLDELAKHVRGPRIQTVTAYARAIGRRDTDGLAEVSAAFESMGDLLAAADAAGQAATLHRSRGQRNAALTAGERTRRLAEQCGGAVSPAIIAARADLPITKREREVASLVAAGMSNREIADLIGLSVRTVESHIQRACSKVGVSTRRELAALVGPRLAD